MPRVTARMRTEAMVREKGWACIGETEWTALRAELAGVSEASLRSALVEISVPVEQPWRGVETASLEALEDSLRAMTEVYASQPAHARLCRQTVIAAKEKARFAARNDGAAAEKRALKAEMVEWMLVWLGDPRMFADWATLRKSVLEISRGRPIQP